MSRFEASAQAIKAIRATHEQYASGYLTEAQRDSKITEIKLASLSA